MKPSTLLAAALSAVLLFACARSPDSQDSSAAAGAKSAEGSIAASGSARAGQPAASSQPARSNSRRELALRAQPAVEIISYDYERCQTTIDESYYAGGYDPLLPYQWYLDLANVKQAWQLAPDLGEGIEIAVVDGGVQLDHEDLAANILPEASVNVLVNTTNFYHNYPYPYDCKLDSHGTAVAGLIAAVGDNGRGIKGIAPKAKIWASNLVAKSKITREGLERTFTNRLQQTAVSSNSWTSASSELLTKADPQFYNLIDAGLADGYYGRGTSYVFAAGNSGRAGDMATYWEVLNHRGIIVVCAVAANTQLASFSETGANLWVCAPSSSGGVLKDSSNNPYTDVGPRYLQGLGLPTTDISGLGGYNNLTAQDYWQFSDRQFGGECHFGELPFRSYNLRQLQFGSPGTKNLHSGECAQAAGAPESIAAFDWPNGATNSYNRFFGGTSAAAPIVSGIIGLIRSAHPELSWRDIKLILAESSKIPEHAAHESQTGALSYSDSTRYYSHHTQYGFGMIDAAEALLLADDWDRPLPPEQVYVTPVGEREFEESPYIEVSANSSVSFIEGIHIELAPNDYRYVNRLSIKLISPNKVESTLMRPAKCPSRKVGGGENRPNCRELTKGFTFGSSAHLGERPAGTWHLEVKAGDIPIAGIRWKLRFYGH